MKLSEAFGDDNSALELIVKAYNINCGLNQPLLAKCGYLNDYSTLVGKVKEGITDGLPRRQAISNAVKFCIENGIMKGYLEEHSEEVFNMLALEWDKDLALQARFDDGFDTGHEKGVESVALNLLNMGMEFEQIQTATKLSFERIEELAKKLKR